jgi:hypothetical protein
MSNFRQRRNHQNLELMIKELMIEVLKMRGTA